MDLLKIAEGWSKSLGVVETTEENKALAKMRIDVCLQCPKIENYKPIKLLTKKIDEVKGLRCGLCKCPINEKALVIDEKCKLGKWENLAT